MANVLDGGQGSPSKSGEGPQGLRISPLGAQIPPTQQQETSKSSAGRRKISTGAAEIEAMPQPPLPTQQQEQQQQQQHFLLPTQPQNFSAGIDGTVSMDIDDFDPGYQDEDHEKGDAGGQSTRPPSSLEPADIAQLPITQPIPYGGTFRAEREQVQVALQQRPQQEEEEEEEPRDLIITPKTKGWLASIKNYGLSKLTKLKRTPPSGGGGSGRKKAPTPVLNFSPPGGSLFGTGRRPLTEGLIHAGRNVNPSQSLQPTEAVPEGTTNEYVTDQDNTRDNLNIQKTVLIEQDETGDDEQQQRQKSTSIDARMDAGGVGDGGEGAASPMRPRPFHQPPSVEGIDIVEEGEVEEGDDGDLGGGVKTRSGILSAAAAAVATKPAVEGIAQRAASSVAQNGAHTAAAAAAAASGRNNFNAFGIGLGGPFTQEDFYGVTATQEDIEAILGAGTVEDIGNAVAAGDQGRKSDSAPLAEPSSGPENAILKGREISKNAAITTGAKVGSEDKDKELGGTEEEEENKRQKGDWATGAGRQQRQSPKNPQSPEKPIARRTRGREAEEITASAVQDDVEYVKKRKMNPTKIISTQSTRAAAAALAEEIAAGATKASTGKSEKEEEEDDDMEPDFPVGGDAYPSSSMPPPPVVLNPTLAAVARDMPTPQAPTPAAQLPSRTLVARERLHALMRQRQLLAKASPSASGADAGVPKPAGVYQPAAGTLRVAVHRPGGVASTGGGSGPNSNDYRTPMAGQTPVHSVYHAGAGGGIGTRRGGAYAVPQQQQQEAPAVRGSGSAAGGTSDVWMGVLQQRQQRRLQQQQRSAASGGAAAKSTLSSLLGL
jgi:hypothetical protein